MDKYPSMNKSHFSEKSSLMIKNFASSSTWRRRYHRAHKCIRSKSAVIILLWSLTVNLVNIMLYQSANYFAAVLYIPLPILLAIYGVSAFVYCFYPLAGYLADVKFGRFKVVIKSFSVFIALVDILFLGSVMLYSLEFSYYEKYVQAALVNETDVVYLEPFKGSFTPIAIAMFILIVPIAVAIVTFNSNVIQFGIDQLCDSPVEYQSLFIFWYFWTYYFAMLISKSGWSFTLYKFPLLNSSFISKIGVTILIGCSLVILLASSVTLLVIYSRRQLFMIDPGRLNPYGLVYKVTKFARQHKVPIRRSAFTYCEDEIPSGLNLGKQKYGGPFTTEEVEDVKAFYGLLKIILVCGLAFFSSLASDYLLGFYAYHISPVSVTFDDFTYTDSENFKVFLLQDGVLSPLLAVIGIPIYLLVIRPFTNQHSLKLLRRVGFGILFMLISVAYTAFLDTYLHFKHRNLACMFSDYIDSFKYQDLLVLVPPRCLSTLSNVLIYTGLYEFLCAQSPHSMKGLLIGLSFAIRGLFEVAGTVMIFPFSKLMLLLPSCGMLYYFLCVTVSVVSLAIYIFVAKKYKLRERDEPCHVHRYVEEYYSRIDPKSDSDSYSD